MASSRWVGSLTVVLDGFPVSGDMTLDAVSWVVEVGDTTRLPREWHPTIIAMTPAATASTATEPSAIFVR